MNNQRTITWDDPFEISQDIRQLSGLEFLQRLIDKKVHVPIGETLGFRLVQVGEGFSVFEAEVGPWAYNPIGSVHGGWYASVLDAALGVALHTTLPKGSGYTTLELKVNLLRPVQPDTGVLRAEGKVVSRGSRIAVTEAHMQDTQGRLYAFGTSTCMIMEG